MVERLLAALDAAAARLGDESEHRVARLATRFGFGGFVRRVTSLDESTPHDPERLLQRLRQHVLSDAAAELSHALTSAGVPHFFTKGIALLGDVYRPGDREMADIDLYVRPDLRDGALQTVRALGYGEDPDDLQSGPAALRVGVALHRAAAENALERLALDVHWGVAPVDRLLPRSDMLLPEIVWNKLSNNGALPVPCDPHHAVLLVHHLVHHDLLHVRGLLDLALIWRRQDEQMGEAARELAASLGVQRALRGLAAVLERDLALPRPRGVEPLESGWRSRRLGKMLHLPEWFVLAAAANEAEHAKITPRRFGRRLVTIDRLAGALRLVRDVVLPPAEHLGWRWPDARSPITAWICHVRNVAGTWWRPR
jgi:hypothetical protein